MGVRFLRFDILPSSPHGGLEVEEDDLEETVGEEGGEEAGEEGGGGGARQQDDEEVDEAFCHVIEPGNAGVRWNWIQ